MQRRAILSAIVIVAASLAVADYNSHGIEFRPLALILVLDASAVGGLRVGITYAVLVATLFTFAEWGAAGKDWDFRVILNSLVAVVEFVCVPILVTYVRQRVVINERLAAELESAEAKRQLLEERESSRRALEHAETTYRAVGESIPFGTWQTDADGNLLYVSESFQALCGMTRDQLTRGGSRRRRPRKWPL